MLILRPSLSRTGTPSLTPGARMRQWPVAAVAQVRWLRLHSLLRLCAHVGHPPAQFDRRRAQSVSQPSVIGALLDHHLLGCGGPAAAHFASRRYLRARRTDGNGARLVSLSGTGTDGVLVIRVWHEAGAGDGFRARVIFGTGDDSIAETNFVIASDAAEVLDLVQNWLAAMGR